MIDAGFHVEPAAWNLDRDALRGIRDVVFVQEQNVPIELEWDDLDPHCDHVLARADDNGAAIGTGRLTPDRKIGRMAVLRDWRGQGVGAAMLRSLIERARERGWHEVALHAQVDAIGFYQRHGFAACGEEFMEAGIRHRHMRLELTPAEPPPTQRGRAPERPPSEALTTTRRDEVWEATLRLVTDARHALRICAPALDPGVLDDDAVLAALQRLATSGRGATLRILLHDAAGPLRDGHRLIPLAQRLPSIIELRMPNEPDDLDWTVGLVLNDAGGFLLRPQADRPDGHGSTCAPREQAPLLARFDEIWERAEPAAELRRLQL